MRFFHIKIEEVDDYSWTEDYGEYHEKYAKKRAEAKAKIAEQYQKLRAIGIAVVAQVPTVVSETQLIDLFSKKEIKFEVVDEIKVNEDDPTDINSVMRKFNRMAAKLMSLPGLQRNDSHHDAYNQKVDVHMPGQALSTYNEVLLLENVCTDALQESLIRGWRIIAACPQPDARRPDYILGRFNANQINIPSSAARSPHHNEDTSAL